MSDFSFIPPTSVVTIPGANASAAFLPKTSEVFKEEHNIAPIINNDKMKYIPCGGDNQMPYNLIDPFVLSDMPQTTKGSWFLHYVDKIDTELIDTIKGTIYKIWQTKERIAQLKEQHKPIPSYLPKYLK